MVVVLRFSRMFKDHNVHKAVAIIVKRWIVGSQKIGIWARLKNAKSQDHRRKEYYRVRLALLAQLRLQVKKNKDNLKLLKMLTKWAFIISTQALNVTWAQEKMSQEDFLVVKKPMSLLSWTGFQNWEIFRTAKFRRLALLLLNQSTLCSRKAQMILEH